MKPAPLEIDVVRVTVEPLTTAASSTPLDSSPHPLGRNGRNMPAPPSFGQVDDLADRSPQMRQRWSWCLEKDAGMQFDHLMHWVPDLDAATQAYQGLGFTIRPGGEHPGHGTRNAAWRVDARYIELITVHDAAVARAGFGPAWPAIEATLRAGGGGLAFAALVSDVAATVTELRSRGVSVTDARAGSLQHSDGSTFTWTLAFLAEGPPWAPFLINYGEPAEEWPARFREWGFPIDPWSLDHLVVETSDPVASAVWLAGVLGLPVVQVGRGAVGVPLPGCTIRFAGGSADRITRVVLAGADAPVGHVAGLYYRRATP